MSDLTKHFRDHVRKLEAIALGDGDEDRKDDATRSLAAFCLLLEGWRPGSGGGDDGGGCEVIELSEWRERMAA